MSPLETPDYAADSRRESEESAARARALIRSYEHAKDSHREGDESTVMADVSVEAPEGMLEFAERNVDKAFQNLEMTRSQIQKLSDDVNELSNDRSKWGREWYSAVEAGRRRVNEEYRRLTSFELDYVDACNEYYRLLSPEQKKAEKALLELELKTKTDKEKRVITEMNSLPFGLTREGNFSSLYSKLKTALTFIGEEIRVLDAQLYVLNGGSHLAEHLSVDRKYRK